jgi:RhtB (resistance to homoserine/threonine) family protein
MSPTSALITFGLAAAVLTITPGMDTMLVLRTAAVEGSRRAVSALLGICCGLLIWGLAVALGVGALMAVSSFAYTVLRWVGAAYLVWLGLTLLRHSHQTPLIDSAPLANGGSPKWFTRGLMTNLTNPKVGVFYVTFLPQFVPPGVPVAPFIVLLAAIHIAEGILWLMLLIYATRSTARLLRRPAVTRALDRFTGAILVGVGLRLAVEGRR